MKTGEKSYFVWNSTLEFLIVSCKVHILWEGHKILRNLHLNFVLCSASQIYSGDFAKFCGLLTIYELYVIILVTIWMEERHCGSYNQVIPRIFLFYLYPYHVPNFVLVKSFSIHFFQNICVFCISGFTFGNIWDIIIYI